MSELLPCPGCGGRDIRHWDAVCIETFCHDCGWSGPRLAKTDDDSCYDEGARLWNKRTPPASPDSKPTGEDYEKAIAEVDELSEPSGYFAMCIRRIRKRVEDIARQRAGGGE